MEAFAGQAFIVPIVIVYILVSFIVFSQSFIDELENKTGREVTLSIPLLQGKIIESLIISKRRLSKMFLKTSNDSSMSPYEI